MLDYDRCLKHAARRLRSTMTDAERHLWSRLRRKQIHGVHFYRQKTIGSYVVDFYAPAAGLVVEVDGAHHSEQAQAEQDRLRTDYLTAQGLRVLRFDDRQVLLEIDAVTETIASEVEGAKRNPGSLK